MSGYKEGPIEDLGERMLEYHRASSTDGSKIGPRDDPRVGLLEGPEKGTPDRPKVTSPLVAPRKALEMIQG